MCVCVSVSVHFTVHVIATEQPERYVGVVLVGSRIQLHPGVVHRMSCMEGAHIDL